MPTLGDEIKQFYNALISRVRIRRLFKGAYLLKINIPAIGPGIFFDVVYPINQSRPQIDQGYIDRELIRISEYCCEEMKWCDEIRIIIGDDNKMIQYYKRKINFTSSGCEMFDPFTVHLYKS